ncbi:NTP transferase domain-containing protein, partial [Veillonella atypica]|uniref:NTP transferase domain-containing protein n=1 Tax=Veillonella atypica TaxID=39777 RepID=UPI0023B14E29
MEYKTGESAPLGVALSREISRIGLVLLAAGQSRRMGTNKQLLPWRGKTILDA